MKQTTQHIWILSSSWHILLVAICIVFLTNSAWASLGVEHQTHSEENNLVQLRAGDHIMGFRSDKVYLVNTTGFLSVDFINSHAVEPLVTAVKTQDIDDTILNQGKGDDALASLQRVEYLEIWDGISLRYDGLTNGIAESTYFIQPGANVSDIRLHYNSNVQLQKDGSLKIILPTGQGFITESKPVAWQVINGRKETVKVAYEIQGQVISYRTGAYNKNHELIIDPTYQWHNFFGSALNDGGGINSIAVDGSGNVYVTGVSDGTWDGPGAVSPINAYNDNDDIVIIKLDSNGTYQWHTFFGGTDRDRAYDLALDSGGNVYVSGSSNVAWNGPGTTSPINAFGTNEEIVIIKLNSSGAYQWHTFYGSNWYEKGRSIAIDSLNNVYVTGATYYAWNGPAGQAPMNPHGGNSHDVVIIKLSSAGAYVWHTFHGAPNDNDEAYGIAVDSSDNVYVTGYSLYTWDGPDTGSGPVSPINHFSGGYYEEIFVIKMDASGTYQWHTFYGAADVNDRGHGIVIDGSTNVIVTGASSATWDGPSGQSPVNGSGQAVVIKLDSAGAYQWHTFHGSDVYQDNAIAIDDNGNIYVTGGSLDWSGPAGENPLHAFSGGNVYTDNMVFKLDSDGAYQWHTFYGAAENTDVGNGIAIDGNNNIYVGGYSNANWNGPDATAPLYPYTGDYDIVIFTLNGKSTLNINKNGLGSVASTLVGIDCGGDCTEIYNDGTNVSLIATAQVDTDFEFLRWTGDCSGTNTTTNVKINGNKTCIATFRAPFPWFMFLPSLIYNEQHK